MTPPLAIDFYGARPDPQAVKNAGYMGVLFYLRNPADAQAYIKAGLGVATIFEYLADESLQGAAKGTADGRLAVQQLESVGQPEGTLHVVNLADFAPTPGELAAIEDYWGAYQSATAAWHVVPYATGWVLENLKVPGWQNAMNNNGVSGSVVVPQAVMYQRVSPTKSIVGTSPTEYDEDVVLADLPWWGIAPPTPAPSVDPIPLGDNMQKIPIPGGVTLNAAGWTCVDVPVPAGITTANFVSAPMDWASAYDPQLWRWCDASPDFNQPTPGHIRMVFRGTPGAYFTGHVVVA